MQRATASSHPIRDREPGFARRAPGRVRSAGQAVRRRRVNAPSTSAAAVTPTTIATSRANAPPSVPERVTRSMRVVGVGQRQRVRERARAGGHRRRAATKSPQSSSCGKTSAGMNCTAWNSVRANALNEEPQRHPEQRVARPRARTTSERRAGGVEPEQRRSATRGDDGRLHRRDQREREPVAGEQVELARSASSSAARASRSCARAAW